MLQPSVAATIAPRASNVETLALAQPVFETLPRSSSVLDGIGTSIPDQLR
jgi:hypothetical protein